MDIYLDVLVIVNIYMTWLILSLCASLTHTYSDPKLRACASLLGGLSSLMILFPQNIKLIALTAAVLKLLACAAIVALAFYRQSLKKYAFLTAFFVGVNMFISSALGILQRLLKLRQIALQCGFIYVDISPLGLMLSTALIYFLMLRFSKLYSKSAGELNSYKVSFKIGSKVFLLDGVADTGNTAHDVFSGLPVIICTGVEIKPEGYIRAVPYKTISGEGILYAANPGKVTLTDERGKSKEVSALVAGLPDDTVKRAIFNPQLLS